LEDEAEPSSGQPALSLMLSGFLQDFYSKQFQKANNFADILSRDEDFCTRATISIATSNILGPAGNFFETVFSDLDTRKEDVFDAMCRSINGEIIKCWCDASSEKKKQFRYNQHFYEYLGTSAFGNLFRECGIEGLSNRLGMIVVAQTLHRMFNEAIKGGMDKSVTKVNRPLGSINLKSEVNRFLGWAIFETRKGYLAKAIAEEWEEEDDPYEEDEDDKLTAPEREERPLDYMNRMVYRHADALVDIEYLQNCYDDYFQLKNCGGLTLVSPAYFEFGKLLLQRQASTPAYRGFNVSSHNTLGRRRLLTCGP
jgi:hypothetical protein